MLYCSKSPIHQEAPEFAEMNVDQEILETGIKVVDLLAPYTKGGKIGKVDNMKIKISLIVYRSVWRSWRWQDCTNYGTNK